MKMMKSPRRKRHNERSAKCTQTAEQIEAVSGSRDPQLQRHQSELQAVANYLRLSFTYRPISKSEHMESCNQNQKMRTNPREMQKPTVASAHKITGI